MKDLTIHKFEIVKANSSKQERIIISAISFIVVFGTACVLIFNPPFNAATVMGIIFLIAILLGLFIIKVIEKVTPIGILEFENGNILIQTEEVVKNIAINNIDQVILRVATGGNNKIPQSATTYLASIKLMDNQTINLHIKRRNVSSTSFLDQYSHDIFSKLNSKKIPWKSGYVDEANCIKA